MDSFNLAFEKEELLESVNNNKNYINSKDRKAWLSNYPEIVLEIDQQLRKYFEINNSRRLVFSIYNFSNSNMIKIHQEKDNVVNRIVISTEDDKMKASNGKNYNLNSWEAYMLPSKFKSRTDIYFQKKIKQKNKFRSTNTRKNTDRYIMIFEYFLVKSEINEIFSNFKKDQDVESSVNDFLKN